MPEASLVTPNRSARSRVRGLTQALLALAISAPTLSAQGPAANVYLVRDIADASPDPQRDSYLQFEAVVAGRAIFWVGSDQPGGRWELWSTDGTAGGTVPISDLLANEVTNSLMSSPLCLDSQRWLFWSSSPPFQASSFWSTDGTNGGTSMVTPLPLNSRPGLTYPGPEPCEERELDGRILFWTTHLEGLQGPTYELWSTDGTFGGTYRVASLGQDPAYGGAGIPDFIRLGDAIIFSLQTVPNGFELWRTDGTEAGTQRFLSQIPGTQMLEARGFARVGDSAFFVGWNSNDLAPLAVTDGTAEGTRVFEDFFPSPGSASEGFQSVALPDRLILSATAGGSLQLWSVAPSDLAPQVLTTFTDEGVVRFVSAEPVGGRVLFSVTSGGGPVEMRDRLLSSDGTASGTVELAVGCDPTGECSIWGLGLLGGEEYLVVSDDFATSIWRTNGTVAGTQVVKPSTCEVGCGMSTVGRSGTKLYLLAGFWWSDWALWVTDGTEGGTFELLAPGAVDLSRITYDGTAALPGGRLLFEGKDLESGYEPWITDGTPGGTHRLINLSSIVDESIPEHFSASGPRVLFAARDRATGVEPWVSDGTSAGTELIADIAPGIGWSNAEPLQSADGVWPLLADPNGTGFQRSFFHSSGTPGNLSALGGTADWGRSVSFNGSSLITTGYELLRFEGDPPALTQLTEIGAGFNLSTFLAAGTQRVYFRNHLAGGSQDLWATDGTTAGTRPFCDAPGDLGYEARQWIGELGAGVVFKASSPTFGIEAYFCYEGGTAILLADAATGSASGSPDGFVATGQWSLFAATDSVGDRELWRTDGTVAGTSRLANLSLAGSSEPEEFEAVEGGVLFTADDGLHGRELWFSDGTAVGTSLLADLAPGPMSSRPSGFAAIGGAFVFSAETLAAGRELWVTTGSPESTQPLPEIRSGPLSSRPEELTAAEGRVFFRAGDSRGSELWALCPSWVAETLIAGAPVQEGSVAAAVVTITLTSAPTCGEARFLVATSGGSATSGEDYVAVAREIVLAHAGDTAAVEIPILDDASPEDGEEIGVVVKDSLGRVRASFAIVIIDDDGGADADGDGVASLAEAAAPNGGDANGDGVPDAFQPAVASYALASPGTGVTVELRTGCARLTGVEAALANAYPGDAVYAYPFGLVRFVAPDCAAAEVRILLHGLPSGECEHGVVRKVLRRDPASATASEWITVADAEVAGVDIGGAPACALTFPIVDGGGGDLSQQPREIDDPVGLGLGAGVVEIPALSRAGLALFTAILLVGGVLRLRGSRVRPSA